MEQDFKKATRWRMAWFIIQYAGVVGLGFLATTTTIKCAMDQVEAHGTAR